MRRALFGLLALLFLYVGSCGPSPAKSNHFTTATTLPSPQVDTDSAPQTPTDGPSFGSAPLVINLEEANPTQTKKPLNIKPHDFSVIPQTKRVEFDVDIEDQKDVKLEGAFEDNSGIAQLFSDDKNSTAVAACLDPDFCDEMVVTVFEKGKEGHQQFVTPNTSPSTPPHTDDNQAVEKNGDVILENDDGLGSGEYMTPESPFEPETVKKQVRHFGYRSQAYGPHSCRDPVTKKFVKYGRLAWGVPFKSVPGCKVTSNQVWALQPLVDLLNEACADMVKKYPDRPELDIGDAAKKKGGFFAPHSSHENGLDLDISYPSKTPSTSKTWEKMVLHGGVNPDLDIERFWFFTKRLVELGDIVFIFVEKPVKDAVCEYAKSHGEYSEDPSSVVFKTLLALWPVPESESSHNSHFHVREQCPQGMLSCKSAIAPEPSLGTGCSK